MVNYNLLKSDIIEEYISSGQIIDVPRYVIRHILVYNGSDFLHICDESLGYHVPIEEKMSILDKSGNEIASLDREKFESEDYDSVLEALPLDFDLWLIEKDAKIFFSPKHIIRTSFRNSGDLFKDDRIKIQEYGDDPYGFTSVTLRQACSELDFEQIKHFLSIGADTTYLLTWVIDSNVDGTTDSVGNATHEEPEEIMRARDIKKVEIMRYILDNYPKIAIKENHLKDCMWAYSPASMRFLLERGANPNEQECDNCHIYLYKYRSVLNLINTFISEYKDKFSIYLEMKAMLEEFGARDILLPNENHKG